MNRRFAHHGSSELIDGQLMPCFEKPQRADHILARVKLRQLDEVRSPRIAAVRRCNASTRRPIWISSTVPRRAGRPRVARAIFCPTPCASACRTACMVNSAITVSTRAHLSPPAHGRPPTAPSRSPVAPRRKYPQCLCPPGHHAAAEVMGGYCYLNNAAIAGQALLDQRRTSVAILDVD